MQDIEARRQVEDEREARDARRRERQRRQRLQERRRFMRHAPSAPAMGVSEFLLGVACVCAWGSRNFRIVVNNYLFFRSSASCWRTRSGMARAPRQLGR